MAFLAPLAAQAGTALAGAGATGAGFKLAGAAVSGLSAIQSALFQKRVAENEAIVATRQAEDAVERSQIEQQEQDYEAAMQIGAETARLAASGFDVTSGSMARRASYRKLLARRDSLRIRNDGEREATAYRNKASVSKTEASGFGAQAIFGALEGATDIGTSLISGASMVNKRKQSTVSRST